MALFSSKRERRLWLWTLAVVVAIYSTLGLAQSLVGALREHGLYYVALDVTLVLFVLGMILVLATVITQGLKTRPGGAEIVVALLQGFWIPSRWLSSGQEARRGACSVRQAWPTLCSLCSLWLKWIPAFAGMTNGEGANAHDQRPAGH